VRVHTAGESRDKEQIANKAQLKYGKITNKQHLENARQAAITAACFVIVFLNFSDAHKHSERFDRNSKNVSVK